MLAQRSSVKKKKTWQVLGATISPCPWGDASSTASTPTRRSSTRARAGARSPGRLQPLAAARVSPRARMCPRTVGFCGQLACLLAGTAVRSCRKKCFLMIRTKPASHRPLVGATRLHLEGCCTHAVVFFFSRGALAKCGSPCLQYTGTVQIAALSPDRFAIVRVQGLVCVWSRCLWN